ncbi:MAG: cytochrome P450 [Anaerolineae bacterium]
MSPFIIDVALDAARSGMLSIWEENWRTYGDLSRVVIGSQATYLVVHPDDVRYIVLDNRDNFIKGDSHKSVRELLLGNGLFTSNGEMWKRQRRLMAPFFTPRGIMQFGDTMLKHGERMMARWDALAQDGDYVDMPTEMMSITASIILEAMFSVEEGHDIVRLKDALEYVLAFTAKRGFVPGIPLEIPTPANQKYKRAVQLLDEFVYGIINGRRDLPEAEWPDDLLSKLMRARDEETGEPMPDAIIRDEVFTAFFAGHETTAKTLAFAWYSLARCPEHAERLFAEVDTVLGGKETLALDDLKALAWTLYALNETLRLYTAAPIYARDVLADDEIGGYHVPAGAIVSLSPYLTHRHPAFWEDPERFDPERFLPENEEGRHPYAYHPFGGGPRICIGNNFALMESHILMAMLARRFRAQLKPGHELKVTMMGTIEPVGGIPMRIVRRS